MNADIQVINKNEIFIVKPLWEKLNKINHDSSPFFKHYYSFFTFEERIKNIKQMNDADVRIAIAKGRGRKVVGYCISTIENNVGEIESLYVDEKFRNFKFGQRMVQETLAWFKKRECQRVILEVAHGNEKVIGFYEKFGFKVKKIKMEMKEQ